MRHMGINELASDWKTIQMTNEAEERIMERLRAEQATVSTGDPVLRAMRRSRWQSSLITVGVLLILSAVAGIFLSNHRIPTSHSLAEVKVSVLTGPTIEHQPATAPPLATATCSVTQPTHPASMLDVNVTVYGQLNQTIAPIFVVVEEWSGHEQHLYAVTNEKVVLQQDAQSFHTQIPVPSADGVYYVFLKSDSLRSKEKFNNHAGDTVISVTHTIHTP